MVEVACDCNMSISLWWWVEMLLMSMVRFSSSLAWRSVLFSRRSSLIRVSLSLIYFSITSYKLPSD